MNIGVRLRLQLWGCGVLTLKEDSSFLEMQFLCVRLKGGTMTDSGRYAGNARDSMRSSVPSDAVIPGNVPTSEEASGGGLYGAVRSNEDYYYEHEAPYADWLRWYRELEYPRYRHPDVTVDCVILTVDDEVLRLSNPRESATCLKALVVDRWTHPFRGSVALPGTFMRPDDKDETAVIARMLRDRFDFDASSTQAHVRQLKTFTGADRDPRGQVVSIANIVYVEDGMGLIPPADGVRWEPLLSLVPKEVGSKRGAALDPESGPERGSEQRTASAQHPVKESASAQPLAFDHSEIVATAIDRVRSQFAWSPYIFWTLPQPFTVTDALKLRASLFDEDYKRINRKNFKRKYQAVWIPDHVEINPATKMPVDYYRYEGAVFE